mmetsp:Transcript_987/g.2497  ORF Transcript_987/g.2497 Transcript_987/m.2497 type:complete len:113 (+) Transcript_987:621-959(+)
MINTVAAHAQNRLDELHKTVERYCGDLSIKDTNSDYSLQSDLCDKLSELEDMHLDWRAGRNQSWSIVQGRKKRMIRTVIVLMDAEVGNVVSQDIERIRRSVGPKGLNIFFLF